MVYQYRALFLCALCFGIGCLVAPQLPFAFAQEGGKKPKWLHGLSVSVRAASEADFTDKTKRVGIEVFRDENNGNLIYVADSGSISVVPGK